MNSILSSIASRTYWLGRQLERAESTARLVSVTANLLIDLPVRLPLGWQPLIDISGAEVRFAELFSESNEKNVTRFLINDHRNTNSLLSSIVGARENARTLRSIMPRETFEYINEMHMYVRESLGEPLSRNRRNDGLLRVMEMTQQIDGFLSGNMPHNEAWQFLRLGTFIERADMTTRIIDLRTSNLVRNAAALAPFEDIQWRSVLQALHAVQNYTNSKQAPVRQGDVLEYLLQDLELPRSYLRSVNAIRNCLRSLPRNQDLIARTDGIRRQVGKRNVKVLKGKALHNFLDACQLKLGKLHDDIAHNYFEYKPEEVTEVAN